MIYARTQDANKLHINKPITTTLGVRENASCTTVPGYVLEYGGGRVCAPICVLSSAFRCIPILCHTRLR